MLRKFKSLFSILLAIVLLGNVLSAVTFSALAAENSGMFILNPNDGPMYSGFVRDETHVQIGTVSAKATAAVGQLMAHIVTFDAVDISEYADGYIHMLLYVEDASSFDSHAYFEISSTGTYDANEMEYKFNGRLQDGWNCLSFKLKDGGATGSIDWTAVNFSRLILQNNGGVPIWFAGLYVTQNQDDPAPPVEGNDIVLPDPALEDDSLWVLNPENGTMLGIGMQDREQVLVGNYSSKFAPASAGLMAVQQTFATPLDLSAYCQSGYLHMDIYVEDASSFDSHAYLELTSSGTYDVDEIQFSFYGHLQDGWNRLSFKLKDGSAIGSIDWSAINFSRLVLQNSKASPIWINGVYVQVAYTGL